MDDQRFNPGVDPANNRTSSMHRYVDLKVNVVEVLILLGMFIFGYAQIVNEQQQLRKELEALKTEYVRQDVQRGYSVALRAQLDNILERLKRIEDRMER